MLFQFIVLYAASTLRKHPENTINKPAMATATTGEIGIKSNTMATIMSSIMATATGAL